VLPLEPTVIENYLRRLKRKLEELFNPSILSENALYVKNCSVVNKSTAAGLVT
jgi:hypothetical protein